MFDIPIITYHKISDKKEIGLTTVSTDQFDRQMKYLKLNGYDTVCFRNLKPESRLPQKPIIITFDDGYENIYNNAIPVLNKYNFKAIIFIVTDYIGRLNRWEAAPFQQKFKHLSGNQLQVLKKNGHEIASHSRRHKYLPSLNKDMLIEEISGSKANLEELLGVETTSCCYPYGRYNKQVKNMVQSAGYHYATANPRFCSRNTADAFSLNRRSIYATDSLRSFKSKITPPFSINFSFLAESIIQKGALASIGINLIRSSKSHF